MKPVRCMSNLSPMPKKMYLQSVIHLALKGTGLCNYVMFASSSWYSSWEKALLNKCCKFIDGVISHSRFE